MEIVRHGVCVVYVEDVRHGDLVEVTTVLRQADLVVEVVVWHGFSIEVTT